MKSVSYFDIANNTLIANAIVKAYPHLIEGGPVISRDDQIKFRQNIARCIGGDYDATNHSICFTEENYLVFLLKYQS